MKICFLYHYSYDNLENDSRVLKEAKTLINDGHQVTIIYGGKLITNKKEIKRFNTRISCRSAWKPEEKSIIYFFCVFLYFIHFLLRKMQIKIRQDGIILFYEGLKINANVYHCHDYPTLLTGYLLKKITGASLIYDAHELTTESTYVENINNFSKKIISFIEKKISNNCNYVITVNNSLSEIMKNTLRIKKPIIISNFSNFISYPNLINEKKSIRTKLKIDKNKYIILYLGAIRMGRGIEKFSIIAKNCKDFEFVFMGKKVEKIVKNIENIPNIHFISPVPPEDVIFWASSADAGISLIEKINKSYYYSLPNKIGEYIMAGLPIVVSDFPEMRKLVTEENIGFVFNPNNTIDIINIIKKLFKSDIYKQTKQNVLNVRNKYCWENEERKLLKIYKEIKGRS